MNHSCPLPEGRGLSRKPLNLTGNPCSLGSSRKLVCISSLEGKEKQK